MTRLKASVVFAALICYGMISGLASAQQTEGYVWLQQDIVITSPSVTATVEIPRVLAGYEIVFATVKTPSVDSAQTFTVGLTTASNAATGIYTQRATIANNTTTYFMNAATAPFGSLGIGKQQCYWFATISAANAGSKTVNVIYAARPSTVDVVAQSVVIADGKTSGSATIATPGRTLISGALYAPVLGGGHSVTVEMNTGADARTAGIVAKASLGTTAATNTQFITSTEAQIPGVGGLGIPAAGNGKWYILASHSQTGAKTFVITYAVK